MFRYATLSLFLSVWLWERTDSRVAALLCVNPSVLNYCWQPITILQRHRGTITVCVCAYVCERDASVYVSVSFSKCNNIKKFVKKNCPMCFRKISILYCIRQVIYITSALMQVTVSAAQIIQIIQIIQCFYIWFMFKTNICRIPNQCYFWVGVK